MRHTLYAAALGLLALSVSLCAQVPPDTSKQVTIDVILDSPVPLIPDERRKMQESVRHMGVNRAEEIVRGLYQDKGFFKADVVTIRTPTIRMRKLVLRVAPGKRYNLTSISWSGNRAVSESELQNLMAVTPGELFSRAKIARGLEAAKTLYASRGYINLVEVPTPMTDDETGTISFVIDVDEGGEFRFGELQVVGMEESHRDILLTAWKGLRERPYNQADADRFFDHFFSSPLPSIKPERYVSREINEHDRLVNYSLRVLPDLRYRVRGSRLELVRHP